MIREVKEETNLDRREILEYLGHFDYLSKSGKKVRQLNFLVGVDDRDIRLTEHDCFVWTDSGDQIWENVTESVKEVLDRGDGF